jgi:tight adherence protein C
MYEIVIASLTFLAIVAIGGAVLSGMAARSREIERRLSRTGGPVQSDAPRQEHTPLLGVLHRVGSAVAGSGPSSNLKEELTRAGYHNASAATIYLGAKIILLLGGLFGLTALLLVANTSYLWTAFGALMGAAIVSFVPNMFVYLQRQRRCREVRNHLPDAVDLLEVCVSSGMGLDTAWNLVSDEIRGVSRTLADEMALTNLEIHLGSPRVTAMRHLADRTGVEDIASLVAVLIQSERFGTSVADALRSFASSMREIRSSNAQESAEKMAVRLLFPMVMFIFPAVLIVLVGPAGMKLAEMMGGR